MRKILAIVLCGILFAGCSKSAFSPDMKGVGFWVAPDEVKELIKQRGLGSQACFSSFLVGMKGDGWDDFEFSPKFGIGITSLLVERVSDGYRTLARKDDFTAVEWQEMGPENAKGFLEFDAFYGSGRVAFKAMKINGEWVIPYMAIPRKGKADDDDPYVIIDLSEDEVAKLMQ